MRSVLPALLVPLLLVSGPALSEDRNGARVARQRTVRVPPDARAAPHDVRIAGGLATWVTLDVPLDSAGPRLEQEDARVRLVPVEGASFLLLPDGDLPEGERLLLTVPLARGGTLSLALLSVDEEVDVQVGFRLQESGSGHEEFVDVARLLGSARAEPVELAPSAKRLLGSGGVRVRLRSVLRLDHHVFVSFVSWEPGSVFDASGCLLLRAILDDGSAVVLPVLQRESGVSVAPRRQFTFVSVLPVGARHLEVAARGEGSSEDVLSLSLLRVRSAP